MSPSHKVCVFGASGGVGKKFVQLALDQGHSVKAVYRVDPKLSHANLQVVVQPNILDRSFLSEVVKGSDVVVSSVGSRRKNPRNPWSPLVSPPDITSHFANLLVACLPEASRFIAVSAGGIGDSAEGLSPVLKKLFYGSNIGVAYKDLDKMENTIRSSKLDWLCVRPVTLTYGRMTEKVKAVDRFRFLSQISRADVAWFMLQNLKVSTHGRTPMIEG